MIFEKDYFGKMILVKDDFGKRWFGKNILFGADWEERKIKELMDKDSNNKF